MPRAKAKVTASSKRTPAEDAALPASAPPLCLYVAWHQQAEDSQFLANEIYRWFRGDPYDLQACGTGIPVLFRAWQPGGPSERPLDLPHDKSGIRVVVLLVDEHFATCTQWRHFVHRLVGRAKKDDQPAAEDEERRRTIVFPVALHPGAFQLAGDVAMLNFLRADGNDTPKDEAPQARRQRRAGRVRNQLTEALGRLLQAENAGFKVAQFDRPPEKISVFLSHAKVDGADCAAALRDEIHRHGQLDAFYDENDLAYGFDYRRELKRALTGGNAVLLAVLSDQYASRPWCRHELRAMRRVHALHQPSARAAGVCKIAPVVVVDALERQTQDHLPELGPAPVFRWEADQTGLIVDCVLRQVLQYAHDLQRAKNLAQRVLPASRPSTFVLNGPPDLSVVAEVRLLAMAAQQAHATLVFPGPGVTDDTRAEWRRLFPELDCRSFDDIEVTP